MNFTSRLIEDAVAEFERLPGIGKKTALRLVLHMLRQPADYTDRFAGALTKLRNEIRYCKECFNISEGDVCAICLNQRRNRAQVCVVENIRDVIAIESTEQFQGLYHVLGGVISPLEGIGPEQLTVNALVERVKRNEIKEAIMALNPTMEGDTTIFYLSKKLEPLNVQVTTLARGIAFGGDMEYVDDLTLARSIATRRPYENYLVKQEG
jgi:recombination protein RecR